MTAEPTEVLIRLRLEYPSGGAPQASAVPVADSLPLLRVSEAATLLAVGEATVWELVSSGELESVKIGASRRIIRSALDSYVARRAGGDGHG